MRRGKAKKNKRRYVLTAVNSGSISVFVETTSKQQKLKKSWEKRKFYGLGTPRNASTGATR